eukprot:g244.t1
MGENQNSATGGKAASSAAGAKVAAGGATSQPGTGGTGKVEQISSSTQKKQNEKKPAAGLKKNEASGPPKSPRKSDALPPRRDGLPHRESGDNIEQYFKKHRAKIAALSAPRNIKSSEVNEKCEAYNIFNEAFHFNIFDKAAGVAEVVKAAEVYIAENEHILEEIAEKPSRFLYESAHTHIQDLLTFTKRQCSPFPYDCNEKDELQNAQLYAQAACGAMISLIQYSNVSGSEAILEDRPGEAEEWLAVAKMLNEDGTSFVESMMFLFLAFMEFNGEVSTWPKALADVVSNRRGFRSVIILQKLITLMRAKTLVSLDPRGSDDIGNLVMFYAMAAVDPVQPALTNQIAELQDYIPLSLKALRRVVQSASWPFRSDKSRNDFRTRRNAEGKATTVFLDAFYIEKEVPEAKEALLGESLSDYKRDTCISHNRRAAKLRKEKLEKMDAGQWRDEYPPNSDAFFEQDIQEEGQWWKKDKYEEDRESRSGRFSSSSAGASSSWKAGEESEMLPGSEQRFKGPGGSRRVFFGGFGNARSESEGEGRLSPPRHPGRNRTNINSPPSHHEEERKERKKSNFRRNASKSERRKRSRSPRRQKREKTTASEGESEKRTGNADERAKRLERKLKLLRKTTGKNVESHGFTRDYLKQFSESGFAEEYNAAFDESADRMPLEVLPHVLADGYGHTNARAHRFLRFLGKEDYEERKDALAEGEDATFEAETDLLYALELPGIVHALTFLIAETDKEQVQQCVFQQVAILATNKLLTKDEFVKQMDKFVTNNNKLSLLTSEMRFPYGILNKSRTTETFSTMLSRAAAARGMDCEAFGFSSAELCRALVKLLQEVLKLVKSYSHGLGCNPQREVPIETVAQLFNGYNISDIFTVAPSVTHPSLWREEADFHRKFRQLRKEIDDSGFYAKVIEGYSRPHAVIWMLHCLNEMSLSPNERVSTIVQLYQTKLVNVFSKQKEPFMSTFKKTQQKPGNSWYDKDQQGYMSRRDRKQLRKEKGGKKGDKKGKGKYQNPTPYHWNGKNQQGWNSWQGNEHQWQNNWQEKQQWNSWGNNPNQWQGQFGKPQGGGKGYGGQASSSGYNQPGKGNGPEAGKMESMKEIREFCAPILARKLGISSEQLWDAVRKKQYCILRGAKNEGLYSAAGYEVYCKHHADCEWDHQLTDERHGVVCPEAPSGGKGDGKGNKDNGAKDKQGLKQGDNKGKKKNAAPEWK